MPKYIMRLDDACERRDVAQWDRMETLLDKYNIRPLVGIIPHCEDPMMDQYDFDSNFWDRVNLWKCKGWRLALHGYNHVYGTECGGINPVNKRSEFAGEPFSVQKEKIQKGVEIFEQQGFIPDVFFAPSHTFDKNTLAALKDCSSIRFISDTIANDSYAQDCFTFVPQQSGVVRKLPFKITTFCYHPNMMNECHFDNLESFLKLNHSFFVDFPKEHVQRSLNVFDKLLNAIYMWRHR